MANTPATGNGPFELTTTSGKQISIPLSAFSFDATTTLHVDSHWSSVTGAQPANGLLAYAVKEQIIAPAALASPFPAVTIKATDSGAVGNNIRVAVVVPTSTVADPTKVPFNITVTEIDVYTGLTAATIESVLGSSAVVGSSPGLVQVAAGSVLPDGVPDEFTVSLHGTPPALEVDGGSPKVQVFKLVGKNSSADGTFTSVTVKHEAGTPPTFSLTATWTKTATGLTVADLQYDTATGLEYEVQLGVPATGTYSLPAAATTQLAGGASGTSASATLFTS